MKARETIKSYSGARNDVLQILQAEPRNVLDVGCSNGTLGRSIKQSFPKSNVVGVEYDDGFVAEARERLDAVALIDLNSISTNATFGNFDLIIFADVLEHLQNPKEVFEIILRNNASKGCYVVISVPNVQHITVLANIIIGVWPERDRGIFDRTHLRWFTFRTVKEFANIGKCQIVKVVRNYRFVDRPGALVNKLAKALAFPPLRAFFTYQYVVLLKISKS